TGTPPPDEEVITREEHQRLQRVVSELPADQQDLLLLRIVGGLTAEEIGTVLGKRAGAVRVALHRILRQLQAKFEGGEVHHG
ncbi:MAG: sigma-70 family RNA polymerase sigma factor, partial [Anaerolineae bacterium]|nr:sigma-70 family RNA polymerase sigma factor [Anaerolineae bacterium]